jgi:hypothetical protein
MLQRYETVSGRYIGNSLTGVPRAREAGSALSETERDYGREANTGTPEHKGEAGESAVQTLSLTR